MEAQFLEWRQVREQVVSGEVHYKVILEAARIRKLAFSRGYRLSGVAQRHEGPHPTYSPSARNKESATMTLHAVATPRDTLPAWPRPRPSTTAPTRRTSRPSAGAWTVSTERRINSEDQTHRCPAATPGWQIQLCYVL